MLCHSLGWFRIETGNIMGQELETVILHHTKEQPYFENYLFKVWGQVS